MRLRSGFLALVVATLSGCQFEASIDVVPRGGTPDFIVTYDKGKAACVEGLTVTSVAAATRPVWAIRRADRAAPALCKDRVTYGIVPTGYEAVVRPQPLDRAKSYRVAATGSGWSAEKPFSLR